MLSKHIEKLLKTKSDEDFWTYVLKHKKHLLVHLDNDSTYVSDESLALTFYNANEDTAQPVDPLGDSDGVCSLLASLDIKYELV
jgi:hypothetical protein